MEHILIGTAVAFFVTLFAIPIIIRIAEIKHLYDLPNDRKLHQKPVPSLGGIGIFAGFILATLIAVPPGYNELQYFMAAAMVIFFLGLKDDIIVLTPLKKFLGQLLAAFILVYKGGIYLDSLYGFMGIEKIPYLLSLIFSYFTIVVITNSFNLIDGVDGLAGFLGLIATFIFGAYFYMAHMPLYAVISFSLSGSILAFLIFNISPARIFMGDTGSLLIGLVNAILVIKFIQVAGNPNSSLPIEAAPAIGFAILFVPLFDTLRIFTYRILSRRSPFSPDRNHVHHLLLEKGLSHRAVSLCIASFNVVIIVASFMAKSAGTTLLLLALLFSGFSCISALLFRHKQRRTVLADFFTRTNEASSEESDSKVILLNSDPAYRKEEMVK